MAPELIRKKFGKWLDENGIVFDFSQPITRSMTLVAQYDDVETETTTETQQTETITKNNIDNIQKRNRTSFRQDIGHRRWHHGEGDQNDRDSDERRRRAGHERGDPCGRAARHRQRADGQGNSARIYGPAE